MPLRVSGFCLYKRKEFKMFELVFLILALIFGFKVLKILLRLTCVATVCLALYFVFRFTNRTKE